MADLEELLVRTSRTFALSIPQLQGDTRRQVGLGYLLLRIADTLEDAAVWPPARRADALLDFAGLLDGSTSGSPQALAASWLADPPTAHEGYLDLLRATDEVLASWRGLDAAPRAIVGEHVRRTTVGMAHIVRRAAPDGELRLQGMPDLRDYCYVVAGIVGEMLTELFLLDAALAPAAEALRRRAPAFGEALQLVNILRDAAADSGEGRTFIPAAQDRGQAFELARSDLEVAEEYVAHLQRAGASRGVVAFTALPVRLAWATLDRVEEEGPGAKLSRSEVAALVAAMHADLTPD